MIELVDRRHPLPPVNSRPGTFQARQIIERLERARDCQAANNRYAQEIGADLVKAGRLERGAP